MLVDVGRVDLKPHRSGIRDVARIGDGCDDGQWLRRAVLGRSGQGNEQGKGEGERERAILAGHGEWLASVARDR